MHHGVHRGRGLGAHSRFDQVLGAAVEAVFVGHRRHHRAVGRDRRADLRTVVVLVLVGVIVSRPGHRASAGRNCAASSRSVTDRPTAATDGSWRTPSVHCRGKIRKPTTNTPTACLRGYYITGPGGAATLRRRAGTTPRPHAAFFGGATAFKPWHGHAPNRNGNNHSSSSSDSFQRRK